MPDRHRRRLIQYLDQLIISYIPRSSRISSGSALAMAYAINRMGLRQRLL